MNILDDDGYAFVCEYAIFTKYKSFSVLVRRKVKESDFCPHGEYLVCDECIYEYRRMIEDQYTEYYSGLL